MTKQAGRTLNRLTDRQARTLGPGRHADGGNLFLVVDASGARRWVFLYTVAGRRREMGLGGLAGLSLAAARLKAHELRATVASGEDPLERKRAAAAAQRVAVEVGPTFGDFADAYVVETIAPALSNDKSVRQWKQTLTDYCGPIRGKPVAAIDTADVLEVLKPLWQAKPETASRLRGRIERVLDAATVQGVRPQLANPARWRGHLDNVLPKSGRLKRGHHAAMDWRKVPAFMADLSRREAMAAKALAFIILTAARAGEALGARWSEVDMVAKVWTIPAERMKGRKAHVVPLSALALGILEKVAPLSAGDPAALVFPGPTRRPLTHAALDAVRERMGVADATTHGFRSAFRDWAGDATNAPREIAEACLAHEVGSAVERAYRRGDALAKRRDLLDQWAAFLSAEVGGNVVLLADHAARSGAAG